VSRAVDRADLLAYALRHGFEELAKIDEVFGYKNRKITGKVLKADAGSYITKLYDTKLVVTPSVTERPPEPFFHLSAIDPSGLAVADDSEESGIPPDWLQDPAVKNFDFYNQRPRSGPPPRHRPLSSRRELSDFLSTTFIRRRRSRTVDTTRLVRLMAAARYPQPIPRLHRVGWTVTGHVLVDYPTRLTYLTRDYQLFLAALEDILGPLSPRLRYVCDDNPGGAVSPAGANASPEPFQMPEPDEPLLIVSDLGLLAEDDAVHSRWLAFGARLRVAGVAATVLLPLPRRYLSTEAATLFDCYEWRDGHHHCPRGRSWSVTRASLRRDLAKVANELLPWLSAPLRITNEFVRAVCRMRGLDAGIEGAATRHRDITPTSMELLIDHEKLAEYREILLARLRANPAHAKRLAALISEHYQCLSPTMYAEALFTLNASGALQDDSERAWAVAHLRGLVKTLLKGSITADEKGYLAGFSHHYVQRQPEEVKRGEPSLSLLYALVQQAFGRKNAPLFAWVDPKMAALAYPPLAQPVTFHAVQMGEDLVFMADAEYRRRQPRRKAGSPHPAAVLIYHQRAGGACRNRPGRGRALSA
jgi:hypothetical protein